MLLTEEVEVALIGKNISYYKNLGYEIPTYLNNIGEIKIKIKSKIKVKIEDLSPMSGIYVEVQCDYCGKIFSKKYSQYILHRHNVEKDCCNDVNCMKQKREEVMMIKYGYKNVGLVSEFREQIEQTNLERYGAINPMQNEEVKQTAINNNQEKYGVNWSSQRPDVQEKIKQTNLEKYGCENVFQNEEIKEKIKQTNLERYGVEHLMKDKEYVEQLIKKINKKRYENGTAPCSTQQKYLHELLGGELNYFVKWYFLDIAFLDEKIYIEYNGSGHDLDVKLNKITQERFEQLELIRYTYFKRKGWKQIVIRTKSKRDLIPQDSKILEMIKYAKQYLNTGHSWIEFDLDNKEIINSQGKFDYNFGELRQIKKELKEEIC